MEPPHPLLHCSLHEPTTRTSPITVGSFNHTIVAVVVVVGAAWIWWVAGARTWFTGPRHNVEPPPEGFLTRTAEPAADDPPQ